MSDDSAHVLDALQAIQRIEQFLQGVTQDSFLADIEKQSAVLHQFTILGEALRRMSDAFRAMHPAVRWSDAIGFRNRIVHDYDEVDLDVVWRITQDDLSPLAAALQPIQPEKPVAGEE